jgi:hypothetical protein
MVDPQDREFSTWEDVPDKAKVNGYYIKVYVGLELKAMLKRRADKLGVTVSQYVREIAKEWVLTHPENRRPGGLR